MNDVGSPTLFGFLVDLKLAIVQASISGYRLPIGLQHKKGVNFLIKYSVRKRHPDMVLYMVMGGNKLGENSRTVLVLLS